MANKQVIEIDVTWTGYSKLKLNWLAKKLMEADMDFTRLSIKEVNKRK